MAKRRSAPTSDAENAPVPRELAREQFHQDAKTSNDLTRAAAQTAILLNGGAATAILAFAASALKGCAGGFPLVLRAAIGTYALGALLGAMMTLLLALSIDAYMDHWFSIVTKAPNETSNAGRTGRQRYIGSLVCFALAFLCFSTGSITLAFSGIQCEATKIGQSQTLDKFGSSVGSNSKPEE